MTFALADGPGADIRRRVELQILERRLYLEAMFGTERVAAFRAPASAFDLAPQPQLPTSPSRTALRISHGF